MASAPPVKPDARSVGDPPYAARYQQLDQRHRGAVVICGSCGSLYPAYRTAKAVEQLG